MFGLPRTSFDYQTEVGDGTGSSVIMAPLSWIGRNFPEAPPALWKQLDDGQEDQEVDHEMLRLLVRPNPFYAGTLLWMATVMDWFIDGNAYWIKVRSETGALKELWWTPSVLLTPQGNEQKLITHYDYRPSANVIRLEADDVVHFRYGIDPDNQRKGRSPIKAVLREVFTDDEAANFTASLLKNMGVPGLLVSPEGDHTPGEDDVKATKAYVAESSTGDRRGEPLVMSGPTKIQQFGFSPEQLSLKTLRRVPEERVAGVLGVPAIVCGLGAGLDRSTFANYAEAREAAYEDNIIPTQRILSEEIRFQLLPDFEDDPWAFRVGFDLSNVRVLQEDQDKMATRMDVGIRGGWIKVSEGRRALSLEAGDEDEIYLRSLSVIETGPAGRMLLELPAAPEPKLLTKGHTQAQRRLIVAQEQQARALENSFTVSLTADFTVLGDLAVLAYEEAIEDHLSSANGSQRKQSDTELSQQTIALIDSSEWIDGRFRLSFEDHYSRTLDETVSMINSMLDLGVSIPDDVQRAIIHRGGMRRGLVDINNSTQRSIFRALSEGRDAGDGPIEIARRIRSQVPAGRFGNAGPAYRAKLIARSETKYAQNLSSITAYKEAETVSAVMAFDARLGDSDEECEARDGLTFSFEDAEREMELEHPNGSLSFAPVVNQELAGVTA